MSLSKMNRREALKIAGMGMLGLAMPGARSSYAAADNDVVFDYQGSRLPIRAWF